MKQPPRVVVIDHASHNTIVERPEYAKAVRDFLANPN